MLSKKKAQITDLKNRSLVEYVNILPKAWKYFKGTLLLSVTKIIVSSFSKDFLFIMYSGSLLHATGILAIKNEMVGL